jgi:TPP-dependent pyruvate/acetoin dehydrogenase alpha subunit
MSNSNVIEIKLFKSSFRIRATEEMIAENYQYQEMKTPVHLGTGQEAPAVAVCENLKDGDAVFSHHRAHNHFLASGGSVFSLVAELYGSEMGCSRGRGGSVHLTHSNKIFFASNAILGESTALAVGSSLSFKMRNMQNISVSFFGDAAWEEGIIYESLNFAAIHKLPTLFVCENNLYSTESPLEVRKASSSEFVKRAESFGVESIKLDGNNLRELYTEVSQSISRMRKNPAPLFIECETYRWREHVGPNFDHEQNRTYRDKSEFDKWVANDPIARLKKYILSKGLATETEIYILEEEIKHEVSSEFEMAKLAPKPKVEDLLNNSGEI